MFESYDTSEGGFNPPLPTPQLLVAEAAAGATSATMKKKLSLKRRMMVSQLAIAQQSERMHSTFLKHAIDESRKRKRSDEQAEQQQTVQLKQRLQRLQAIAQQYRARKQQRQSQKQQPAQKPKPASAKAGASNKPASNGQPAAKKLKR